MKKIFQYIILVIATIVVVSCTSDIENTTVKTGKSNILFVVGDFPTFGDSQTRAIGTPDEGKTSWEAGDELLLEVNSRTLGAKYATFTYNGNKWELTSGEPAYKEDEVPFIPHVYYAPNYKWESGKLTLKEGKVPGMDEYIEGTAQITPNGEGITVSFSNATRNYSRLRIATIPNKTITVVTNKFVPAQGSGPVEVTYSLTSDNNGNAFLYGNFEESSSVIVKYGEIILADYTFEAKTENNKSYALDATVISTNSTEDIKSAIAQKIVDGKTNIRLYLASDADDEVFNAIRESLKNVTPGSINLVLIGCEQIPKNGLDNYDGEVEALKSISLPNVTKIGYKALSFCVYLEEIYAPNVTAIDEQAFEGCKALKKVTFGELTDVKGDYYNLDGIFSNIYTIDNIDLVLSEKQKILTRKTIENRHYWTPAEGIYTGSTDHENRYFLGMTFQSITCGI